MPTPVYSYSVYNSYKRPDQSRFEKFLDNASLPLRRFRGGIDVHPYVMPCSKNDPEFMTNSKIYTRIAVGLVISPLLAINSVVLAIKYVWTVLLTSRSKEITEIMQKTINLKESNDPEITEKNEEENASPAAADEKKEIDTATLKERCKQILDQPVRLQNPEIKKNFNGMLTKLFIQEDFDLALFKRLAPSQKESFYRRFFTEINFKNSPITIFNFSPLKFLDNILSLHSDKDQNRNNLIIESEIFTILDIWRNLSLTNNDKKITKFFLASILYRKASELIDLNYKDPVEKKIKIDALQSKIESIDSTLRDKICYPFGSTSKEYYDLFVTWMKSIDILLAYEKSIQSKCESNHLEDVCDDLASALEIARPYVGNTPFYETLNNFSDQLKKYKAKEITINDLSLPSLYQEESIDKLPKNVLTPETNSTITIDKNDSFQQGLEKAHFYPLNQIYLDIYVALHSLKAQS